MALSPPPNQAEPGTPIWNTWFTKLQQTLSSVNGIAWSLVDKTGSNLSDLANRTHAMVTGIQGTGSNHVSSAENTTVTALNDRGIINLKSKAGLPTATEIPASQWAIYKNTNDNKVYLVVNDGGTLKKVELV